MTRSFQLASFLPLMVERALTRSRSRAAVLFPSVVGLALTPSRLADLQLLPRSSVAVITVPIRSISPAVAPSLPLLLERATTRSISPAATFHWLRVMTEMTRSFQPAQLTQLMAALVSIRFRSPVVRFNRSELAEKLIRSALPLELL